jgi:hypothetical protein
MKKLQLLSITTLLLLLLAGCGESSNRSVFGDTQADGVYTLSVGESSQVLAGDILEPNDANTRIQIEHIIDDDTKYVTILSGSATLLRGSYAVQ